MGHRLSYWVFPVGAFAFSVVIGVLLWLLPSFRESLVNDGAIPWTAAALGAWTVPTNLFGRMFLIGFIATVFAGEYQWSTWKNVIPRTHRVKLLLAKFLALAAVILLAFSLMAFSIRRSHYMWMENFMWLRRWFRTLRFSNLTETA